MNPKLLLLAAVASAASIGCATSRARRPAPPQGAPAWVAAHDFCAVRDEQGVAFVAAGFSSQPRGRRLYAQAAASRALYAGLKELLEKLAPGAAEERRKRCEGRMPEEAIDCSDSAAAAVAQAVEAGRYQMDNTEWIILRFPYGGLGEQPSEKTRGLPLKPPPPQGPALEELIRSCAAP
jgi:hypothetical protein